MPNCLRCILCFGCSAVQFSLVDNYRYTLQRAWPASGARSHCEKGTFATGDVLLELLRPRGVRHEHVGAAKTPHNGERHNAPSTLHVQYRFYR